PPSPRPAPPSPARPTGAATASTPSASSSGSPAPAASTTVPPGPAPSRQPPAASPPAPGPIPAFSPDLFGPRSPTRATIGPQSSEIIRADAALAGRVLRLANCAFFAQRQPITNLDRSCVLLGVDRLKSVALGFYLSRAAAGDPRQSLSRRIWGQSVYRACLSA